GRHAELLTAIDRRLQDWKNQPGSPYFKVLERWGAPYPTPLIPHYLIWTLAGLLAALLFASGFAYLLRKQVQKRTLQLHLSENKMHTILNSVDAYIFIKDIELRYQYVNQKICNLTGLSQKQIIGRSDDVLFDSETTSQLLERDRNVLETGKRLVLEERNRLLNDGRLRTYLTAIIPL